MVSHKNQESINLPDTVVAVREIGSTDSRGLLLLTTCVAL